MSIDLVLCGATGRLGKEILIEVGKQSNINLIGCVASKNNKNFGKKIATFIESNCELELKDSFEEISKPDVVIDVSSPEAFEDIVKFSELNFLTHTLFLASLYGKETYQFRSSAYCKGVVKARAAEKKK